jgi:hypothetical protein
LSREERRAACDALNDNSVSLLLATDAAGEGLNLHFGCRWVINFELPWNPARLEQRAGRVDRYGQRRKPHVLHLVARDTAETIVLAPLEARLRRAQRAGWLEDVWPAEPAVAAAVLSGARLHEPDPDLSTGAPSAPAVIAALATSACADASLTRHIERTTHCRPLLLELTPARLARRRNGLDRLAAGGQLFFYRLTITDAVGQIVDSTIVAATDREGAGGTYGAARLEHVRQFRHEAAERLLERWRTIGGRTGPFPRQIQPALFDRRAIDLARTHEEARAALARDLTLRIDRLQRSRTLTLEPPELLLVARIRSDGRA